MGETCKNNVVWLNAGWDHEHRLYSTGLEYKIIQAQIMSMGYSFFTCYAHQNLWKMKTYLDSWTPTSQPSVCTDIEASPLPTVM